MSSIRREGNTIFQGLDDREAELGRIAFEENTQKHVLWLKDHAGIILGTAGAYCRADEYDSIEEAWQKAPRSPAAFILHLIWMRQCLESDIEQTIERDWDEIQALLDEDVPQETFRNVVLQRVKTLAKGALDALSVQLAREGVARIVSLFTDPPP